MLVISEHAGWYIFPTGHHFCQHVCHLILVSGDVVKLDAIELVFRTSWQ